MTKRLFDNGLKELHLRDAIVRSLVMAMGGRVTLANERIEKALVEITHPLFTFSTNEIGQEVATIECKLVNAPDVKQSLILLSDN